MERTSRRAAPSYGPRLTAERGTSSRSVARPSTQRGTYNPTVPAVRNTVNILRYLFQHSNSRAHVIAAALKINRSTCHGILKTLVAGGFLVFDEVTKTYKFGPVIIAIGARAREAPNYVLVARPLLERWVAATSFTIFIALPLPDKQFLVVDRVESTRDIKVTVSIGERFPLAAAALGKAYLAWLAPHEARGLIGQAELPAFTRNSITGLEDFMAELEETRRQGWSVSRREYYGGSNAVAAPVFGSGGEVVMVMCSLAADSDMTTDRLDYFGGSIKRFADQLSTKLLSSEQRQDLVIGSGSGTGQP